MTALLQISRRMQQWKNFENRTVFDEVICRLRWLTFLAHPVCWKIIYNKMPEFYMIFALKYFSDFFWRGRNMFIMYKYITGIRNWGIYNTCTYTRESKNGKLQWRYINHLLTYLLTYMLVHNFAEHWAFLSLRLSDKFATICMITKWLLKSSPCFERFVKLLSERDISVRKLARPVCAFWRHCFLLTDKELARNLMYGRQQLSRQKQVTIITLC